MNFRDGQHDAWETFYTANKRPWRGVAKLPFDIPEGCDALDLGCGNGKTVLALMESKARATGVDFSEKAIGRCKQDIPGAEFLVADSSDLPFKDDSFDVITMVHILDHLDDTQLALTVKEVQRILRPNGKAFVRCFAENDLRSDGKDENTRGNGIVYRYLSKEFIAGLFDLPLICCDEVRTEMRYGGERVRIEALFGAD